MKRVLVVDDEPELTEVVRECLPSGPAALEAARAHRPHVVFCDINMPGPSGIEVLKALQRADPTIPVVVVTVDTEMSTVQACLREGAFAYIPKPFDLKYVEHMAALSEQRRGAADPTPV